MAAAPAVDDPAQHPGAVTSPMVGTVYLAAEPGAAPFVTVGAQVAEGQTVLIIEAMKTMNQIPAPRVGHGQAHRHRGWQPGGIRRAPDDHRMSAAEGTKPMFDKILIANRGEIALRVVRACREMGITSVAVHSTADADAMHVRMADESVCIGPAALVGELPEQGRDHLACEITGAQAVHPGYGFLSENAAFAQALEDHDITFIGPSAEHIRIMGDKITAKETAKALGIPVVPGSDGGVPDFETAIGVAAGIGFPVIIKATAGGGGRGMKVARDAGRAGNRVPHGPGRGQGGLRQ